MVKLYNNEGAWCLIFLGLATILSFFPILVLKDGGSWTFFSLLPLWLITYFFGFRTGLLGSFIFCVFKTIATFFSEVVLTGALMNPSAELMTKENFIEKPQIFILEYIIACTGFCVGGLLSSNRRCHRYIMNIRNARNDIRPEDIDPVIPKSKKITRPVDSYRKPLVQIIGEVEKENSTSGLIAGYIIGVFIMFICYICAAPLYDAYPDVANTYWEKLLYDIRYDGSYLLTEAATTVILLAVPPVRQIIFRLKHIANNPEENKAMNSF